jgi:hypothetical protein
MNTNVKLILALGSITLLSFSSCRPDPGPEPEPTPIAGKGGGATLNITARHHARDIDSCKVYIKYNASDKPLTYDDSAWCRKAGGRPVATFPNLKKGKYYIYGRGWDPEIEEAVDGGVPYEVKQNAGVFDYNLAVTEDH